jgi:terminase small subunit-like protein
LYFRDQYARAREEQADKFFKEIIEIADDASGDYVTTSDGKRIVDHENIQRSRLRVDARKWAAARQTTAPASGTSVLRPCSPPGHVCRIRTKSASSLDHLIGAGEHDVGLQPDGMGRRLHISRHRFSYPYFRFAAHVEKADASKEMQRRRIGMITNFLLSPLVNLVWG